MKRLICLLLALASLLCLCACGKKSDPEEPAETPPEDALIQVDIFTPAEEASSTPAPTPGVIAQICQTYCVVLRDEYADLAISSGDYRVEFSLTFDVYYNTLDVDTKEYRYGHTNDFGYADAPMKEATATKTAVFDRNALPTSAYGTDFSRYRGYSNAFFSGWANINMESKVWSGFYIDLSQVKVESASGTLQLAD